MKSYRFSLPVPNPHYLSPSPPLIPTSTQGSSQCFSHIDSITLPYQENLSVLSPDSTTLFCTSGMQRLKPLFEQIDYVDSFCNVQRCLRLNDLDEIGDSTHYLVFHMLGMFSFRQLGIKEVIQFWLDFLKSIDLYPHYVTIHPDKIDDWRQYYPIDMPIRPDTSCLWSDGKIGGFCTEFYYNDVEIGNIVNPLGTCIDVGFGVERLVNLKYGSTIITKSEIIKSTCEQLISEGVVPSPNKQGHILRKLLLELSHGPLSLDHQHYRDIVKNQLSVYSLYLKMINRSKHYLLKPDTWWKNSFGVDIHNLKMYDELMKKHPELIEKM